MTTAPVAERVIEFIPTATQQRVWDIIAEAPDNSLTLIGYGGALGGGKTRTLAEIAIDLSIEFPGNRGLIGRKDLVDLRTTTLEEFDRVCPPELIVKAVSSPVIERHIRLPQWPAGVVSRVFFKELKDYQSIGSEEYGWVAIEEAGEVPINSARMLIGRLRWDKATVPLKRVFLAASNPYPGWFEDWFVNHELPEDVLKLVGGTVHFIPAKISDNPYLPDNYEALLRAVYTDDDWLQRMVEGRFDSFTGQVYRELSPLMEWNAPLPKQIERLTGGLDFGGANPDSHKTAGVASIVTAQGNPGIGANHRVRFAHFEHSGADVHELLWSWMRSVEVKMGRRVHWRADKTQSWGISLAQQAGFIITPSHGGADSVTAGIGLNKRRMKDGTGWYTPELRQIPELDGRRMNGRSWYEGMRRYRWSEDNNPNTAAKGVPLKRDDDTADADRYDAEEVDGFPAYSGPAIRSLNGKPLARIAV